MKYIAIVLLIFIFSSCQGNNIEKTENNTGELSQSGDFDKESLVYSNINSDKVSSDIKKLFSKAGISNENITNFLNDVNEYNSDIENISLTNNGYNEIEGLNVEYDELSIINLYEEKKYPFIGKNCRISTYKLLDNLVEIGNPDVVNPRNLLIDNSAISSAEKSFFSEEEKKGFNTFFGNIPTPNTKDIDIHIKNVQDYWKEKGVKFIENNNVSLISVFFHSTLDDVLFIGHTGLLFPYEGDKIAFVEKLSFQLPYQLVIFNNREELNDYLMRKYDVSYNQPEARPFIMENNKLMDGYRKNIKNSGSN